MADSLLTRLRSALQAEKNFSKELKTGRKLTVGDAAHLCAFLAEQVDVVPLLKTEPWGEYHVPLYYLVMPFQQSDDEPRSRLQEDGLPELARLCDLRSAHGDRAVRYSRATLASSQRHTPLVADSLPIRRP